MNALPLRSVRPAPTSPADGMAEHAALVRRQLELLGEDLDRDGIRRTPERVATALSWLTRGYSQDVSDVVGNALFAEEHRQMVMVRDVDFYSLCEHHMLPFYGKAHIAYVPNGRIVGLSKLPRIVEVYARRLQVQERLTEQIAAAVERVAAPRRRRRGRRGRTPLHDDARRREAGGEDDHERAPWDVSRVSDDAGRVSEVGASVIRVGREGVRRREEQRRSW